MRLVIGMLAALALGATLGLGATWWTAANGLPVAGLTIGAWRADPDAGTIGADPYEIARIVRTGEAPLSYGDGVSFTATADDAGRPLDAACDYELAGDLPSGRLWTLSAFSPEGRRFSNGAKTLGVTSASDVRVVGQKLKISVSAQARPGAWAPLEGQGPFTLRLSLYETVIGTPLERANPPALLSVRRLTCR